MSVCVEMVKDAARQRSYECFVRGGEVDRRLVGANGCEVDRRLVAANGVGWARAALGAQRGDVHGRLRDEDGLRYVFVLP